MVTIEEDTLAKLNQTYIDTRYPASLGFSPNGLPDNKKAEMFYEFAVEVFVQVESLLQAGA